MKIIQLNPLYECVDCGSLLRQVGPRKLEHPSGDCVGGDCVYAGKIFDLPTFDLTEAEETE